MAAALSRSLDLTELKFPNYDHNYQITVVEPCKASGGTLQGETCVAPPPPPEAPTEPLIASVVYAPITQTGLLGSIGRATPGGNCVLEVPGAIRPDGNPITWPVSTQSPYIGAVALFNYNHVGIVTGIWPNGDLEIRHQNFSGGIHRFSRSDFRGFR